MSTPANGGKNSKLWFVDCWELKNNINGGALCNPEEYHLRLTSITLCNYVRMIERRYYEKLFVAPKTSTYWFYLGQHHWLRLNNILPRPRLIFAFLYPPSRWVSRFRIDLFYIGLLHKDWSLINQNNLTCWFADCMKIDEEIIMEFPIKRWICLSYWW